jgi:hypothetical protein
MRHSHLMPLLILVALATPAPAQVASLEEIADLVGQRKYPQALQAIGAGLALKGPAAKLTNRYELFMFKGECHLQVRALPMAVEAYANAAKEEQATRAERAIAAAPAALLKGSRAFAYAPKAAATPDQGRPSPIDLLDKSNRKRAFAAMLADELNAVAGKVKAAKAAKTLGPIVDVAGPLAAIEGVELAATGEAAKVTEIRTDLTARAKRVLADTLREATKRVSAIDKEANTFVETWQDTYQLSGFGNPTTKKERVYKKRGLKEADTIILQETAATCGQIDKNAAELAAGLGAEPAAFDAFADDAGRLRKEVARVLEIDYQRVYREIPKK